jgi:hypothetical protein
MDAVLPQKRHTAISESLTRLTRSPLLTGLEGAGRLLKSATILEIHATRESYRGCARARLSTRKGLASARGDAGPSAE